jgi:hypothetical protein
MPALDAVASVDADRDREKEKEGDDRHDRADRSGSKQKSIQASTKGPQFSVFICYKLHKYVIYQPRTSPMFLVNSSKSEHVQQVLPVLSLILLRSLEHKKSLVPGLSRAIVNLATSVPLRTSFQVRACPWIERIKKLRNRLPLPLQQLLEELKKEERRGGKSVKDRAVIPIAHMDETIPYLQEVLQLPLVFYRPRRQLRPPTVHLCLSRLHYHRPLRLRHLKIPNLRHLPH